MDILSLVLVAVALSMDAFAVAVTSGIVEKHLTAPKILKLAFFFGFFQFAMPVIGYYLGISVSSYIEVVDHWIAFGLLAFIGGKMILDVLRGGEEEEKVADPFGSRTLLIMAVATSIDALAVGVSFALAGSIRIWISCLGIGCITFVLSTLGVLLGKRVGELFQKRATLLGGLILIGIGVKILVEHLS